MSYEPTEWACGDDVTANKLNKIENGLREISGGGYTPTNWTCGDVVSAEKLNKIEQELAYLSENCGGGECDFSHITLMVPEDTVRTYYIIVNDLDNKFQGVIEDEQYGLITASPTDPDGVRVAYGSPQTFDVLIAPGHYILAMTESFDDVFEVTGDAEAVTITEGGATGNIVKIYGDCTISALGSIK